MPEVGFVGGGDKKACVYLIFMDIAQTPALEVLQIHDTPQWGQICFLTAEQALQWVPVSELKNDIPPTVFLLHFS